MRLYSDYVKSMWIMLTDIWNWSYIRYVAETRDRKIRPCFWKRWNGRSRVLLADGPHEIIKKYSSYIISIIHDLCCTNVERIFPKDIAREIYVFRVRRCTGAKVFPHCVRKVFSSFKFRNSLLRFSSVHRNGKFAQYKRIKTFYMATRIHAYTCVLFYVSRIFDLAVNLKFKFNIGKMYVHIYMENLERKENKLFSIMLYLPF